MKKSLFFYLTLLLPLAAASCVPRPTSLEVRDYTVQADCLRHPEKAIAFTRRAADFWKQSHDPEDGGFFTLVDRTGAPAGDNQVKTVLTQSRNAYGFARAYMLTGDAEYLEYARHALDFLYAHGWDEENGGFYSALTKKGEPGDAAAPYPPETKKWGFMQHHAMLGIAAMYEATRDARDYEMLLRARRVLDEKLWDNREGYEGYYEIALADWSSPANKGFTSTLDAITTHALALPLLTNDPGHTERFIALADNIINHIMPTTTGRDLGFARLYDSNWAPRDNSFLTIGHVLKTAWCLGRAHLIEPKTAYIEAAELLMEQVWTRAWDHRQGAPYYSADSVQGTIIDRHKDWWTVEQGVTAGLVLYYITGNESYLRMADQAMMFFTQHQLDEQYGEAFAAVNPDEGAATDTDTMLKGDYWKAGYHTIETGYYAYLLGKLYLHQQPVNLFYRLKPEQRDRTLRLTPLAIQDKALRMDSVLLNGQPHANFNANNRTVFIPAGLSGELRVRFAIQKTGAATHCGPTAE